MCSAVTAAGQSSSLKTPSRDKKTIILIIMSASLPCACQIVYYAIRFTRSTTAINEIIYACACYQYKNAGKTLITCLESDIFSHIYFDNINLRIQQRIK
jgi:hypothetical protein